MKFDPRHDNLLSMSNEKAHAELRAKVAPGVCLKPPQPDEANPAVVWRQGSAYIGTRRQ